LFAAVSLIFYNSIIYKLDLIYLEKISKRFRNDWIFRNVNYTFRGGQRYAILGHNGAGKSTFLQILSGHLSPSVGQISYTDKQGRGVDSDDIFRLLTYTAPYIDIIEELTLTESIDFHAKFKPFGNGLTTKNVMEIIGLPKGNAHKEIRYFSSGMRQRLKIALAVLSDVPIVLLDEPTTNLDAQGVEWYRNLILNHTPDKLVIIASNTPHDYDFCENLVDMTDFKK
jgi:ABC-type multidrug transport system ATPase subunit